MPKKFDYARTVSELEDIVKKVEDPTTPLEQIGALVTKAGELIETARGWLRSERDKIEKKAGE